jgi:hypothetical protein
MNSILSPIASVLGRGFVAAALALTAHSASAAIPGPEKLLPDDTLAMVTTPDFVKFCDVYKAAPQSQLWNDPSLKPFRDKFMTKLQDDLVKPLERELGIQLENYTSLPQGQITFAITLSGPDAEPGFVLLIDSGNRSSQLKTNLTELKRKWVDSGKTIRTENVRDIEFSVLRLSDAELPASLKKVLNSDDDDEEDGEEEEEETPTKTDSQSELVFAQHESMLIVGCCIKSVEKVAAHLTGGSAPALIDVAAFESSYRSTFRDAPFYAWANVKIVTDQLAKRAARDAEENPIASMFNVQKLLTASGLGSIKAIGFSGQTSPEGFFANFSITAPESERTGLMKLFPSSGKDSLPPAFVPADAIKFQRVRIDGSLAWNTFTRMASEVWPQVDSTLNFMIEQINESARQKDPNFDVRKSLFENLGDDMIVYEKAPKGSTIEELASAPSIFLISSPQPDQLANALSAVLSIMNPQASSPEQRDFLGRKIYSLTVPASPLAAGARPGAKLHYASSGGYLALTTDASLLEELLRSSEGEQKKLRDTAGFTEAVAKVGGGSTGWFNYENQRETLRSAFEILRQWNKDEEPEMLAPGVPAFVPENPFKEWFDFSLLPSFDQIAKYFSYVVVAGNANSEGITFRFFEPVSSDLRK